MEDFRSTPLWKASLKQRRGEARPCALLREAFESFRERARMLAAEIPQDVRDLTVHDVTHLDALWETAGIIVGSGIVLNPVEAFVLGGAFLIHDLGLALVAWPDGLKTLKALPAWRDLIVGLLRRRSGRQPSESEIANPPTDVAEETKFWILRQLHGERAEALATFSWVAQGTAYHLIEQPELRSGLGPLIGRIAHSHSWPVEKVVREFSLRRLGSPPGFPSDWTIDSLKLAFVLRLADAAHIDARRAPSFLRALRNPRSSSADHWTFQGKLNQVTRQGDRLVYSGRGFTAKEAQAWWLCNDTLRMIDSELREVDNANADLKRPRFAARGVFAADDAVRLAQLIPTDDWTPVDAQVRVTRVASLVRTLGGNQLYGNDGTVPLRELIQNAGDAVRARRVLEGLPSDWGEIVLRVGTDSSGAWIEIEDNGVGMSDDVLTKSLLDFGNSFWSSPEAASQFPNLLSKGFESSGRFGIGFFSVFMWGDKIRIITRRYDEAKSKALVLEFSEGLGGRPLLRPARDTEQLKLGGTLVRVWPRGVVDTAKDWIELESWDLDVSEKGNPAEMAYWLCPSLDVNLSVETDGRQKWLIRASDWTRMLPSRLLRRISAVSFGVDPKKAARNVRPIFQNGKIVGRGCVLPGRPSGTVTVGGLRSFMSVSVAGIFTGEATVASRHEATLHASDEVLAAWATEQAGLVRDLTEDLGQQGQCAQIIAALGGQIGDLPIGRVGKDWLDSEHVVKWAVGKESVIVIDSDDEGKFRDAYGSEVKIGENVIVQPRTHRHVVEAPFGSLFTSRFNEYLDKQHSGRVRRPILRAVAQAWGIAPNDIELWRGDMDIGELERFSVDGEELKKPEEPR
jgi:hypothetical protein